MLNFCTNSAETRGGTKKEELQRSLERRAHEELVNKTIGKLNPKGLLNITYNSRKKYETKGPEEKIENQN